MDVDADFDARLDKAGVRFTERDVELLLAIRKKGSLNKAADALDRSYSRAQQRIVDLEEAFGQLVDRQRGGSGGGGSTLTDTAAELLVEFDRLQAEFTGVTEVSETVLRGQVIETNGELGTIETAAGPVRAIVPSGVSDVRLAIRADAITLHRPDSVPESQTSARNHFEGTVSRIESGEAVARVVIDVGANTDLIVLVTQTSVETLDLAPGEPVAASFKATATRAYRADSSKMD